MPPPKQTNYDVQSVNRALDILEAFDPEHPEWGVSALSRELRLHKATTYRLLQTLRARGLVEQNPLTGNYRLGLRLYELGLRVISPADLIYTARDYLRDLAARVGESASIAVLNGRDAVTISKADGQVPGGVVQTLGRSQRAHTTANGKVLLAHLPPTRLDALLSGVSLEPYTDRTITNPDQLRAHLAQVRRQGYALDNQETAPGLCCAAAPIRDHSGAVVAAIGISGPSSRLNWARDMEKIQEVVRAAEAISRHLGYLPQRDPLAGS
ncbi:MAG: IclR family transcriptional regulator [Anaerolineae bacterium]